MYFANIRIILVGTTHPGNIGATARAMKTMGLSQLYLVAPKIFPSQNAYEMAAGADDILENAVVVGNLDEAIADCQLVLATSARPRGIDLPGLDPRESAVLMAAQPEENTIAVLFGREHAGLTNDELLRSQFHINIPANPHYSSLNLAQAVQIIAYEVRMAKLADVPKLAVQPDSLATYLEVEQFYNHLEDVMIATGFFNPENPRRLLQRLRRLFNRSRLEKMEVNILRGILRSVQDSLK